MHRLIVKTAGGQQSNYPICFCGILQNFITFFYNIYLRCDQTLLILRSTQYVCKSKLHSWHFKHGTDNNKQLDQRYDTWWTELSWTLQHHFEMDHIWTWNIHFIFSFSVPISLGRPLLAHLDTESSGHCRRNDQNFRHFYFKISHVRCWTDGNFAAI